MPPGQRDRAARCCPGPITSISCLRNRQRIRAGSTSDCPALDFYGGFYLQPDDERICAKRDSIHSRMGGSCRIERFRHARAASSSD